MCSEPGPHREPAEEKPPFHLKLRVPGHRSSISTAVERVMGALAEWRCAAGREFAIETALREALANAVMHGCRNDPAQVVDCVLSPGPSGELHIVVRDHGAGFDPRCVPDPLSGENLLSTHGRGIYLITHLVDRVWFEHGGTEIHMILEPRAAASGSAKSVGMG
jgi:serine/threonine-protein kinase RsbW